MSRCCICYKDVVESESAVLTISAAGNPRLLCPECDEDFERATRSHFPEEIYEAIEKIGNRLVAINSDDDLVVEAVSETLKDAAERAELIKNGVYDFENDELQDEPVIEDIPEELLETEEDRMLDAAEEKQTKKIDAISSYICFGILILALAYFIYRVVTSYI